MVIHVGGTRPARRPRSTSIDACKAKSHAFIAWTHVCTKGDLHPRDMRSDTSAPSFAQHDFDPLFALIYQLDPAHQVVAISLLHLADQKA